MKAGKWGESVAARLLRKKGYRIVARRLIIQRAEIDLIAKRDGTLVFVEVKTRAEERFGRPASAVGRLKKRRITRAALEYLRHLRSRPDYVRFDIIEVIGRPDGGHPVARHVENAFTLSAGARLPW
ncbi:MAG: YraN family protein [Kiritimatiellae bacterium]|nr:YraN family protein [Kiritimatiellia bacterium]MDW8457613.1 YraN family protein [Verrucomicrobiota bacterium]